MNKIKNSKGFTLMEMLIVVAIIAVLVAIAIPTFTTSLNKARVATDEANIRSGYASVMAEILTNQISDDTNAGNAANATYTLLVDGSVRKEGDTTNTGVAYATKGKLSWDVNIAGYKFSSWEKEKVVTYVYSGADNTVTINVDGTPGVKTTGTNP